MFNGPFRYKHYKIGKVDVKIQSSVRMWLKGKLNEL
jgi:hypothetical protein